MNKQQFILVNIDVRLNAIKAMYQAPDGYVLEIKPPTRNLEQNAKLWAMLSDISKQVTYHSKKLSVEDWKSLFTGSLRGFELVPNINSDGGYVMLGESTSQMSKSRFSELIEMIYAFGSENDVIWSEKTEKYFLEYLTT